MHALVASLLSLVAGVVLLWSHTDGFQALTAERASRLEAARSTPPVAPFTVETMDGTVLRVPRVNGRVALVEFIYTRCPTLCQSAGADMKRLGAQLEVEDLADRVSLLSVSFDPTHDDVPRLADYGRRHRADGALWTVGRPQPAALAGLLSDFGVTVIPDGYGGLAHNVAVHLVTADGRLAGIFDPDDFGAIVSATRRTLGP